jgi:predicted RNase H-like HicB family nuclease
MAYYIGIIGGEGDVWGVRIPDLPGCHGGGPTADAAVADAISAAGEWAAYMLANGYPVNPPRDRSSIISDPECFFDVATESTVLIPLIVNRNRPVKANISLDAGALDAIDAAAKRVGLTRSNFIVGTVLDKIAEDA